MKYITKMDVGNKLYAIVGDKIQYFTIESIDVQIHKSFVPDNANSIYTTETYQCKVGESAGARQFVSSDQIGKKYFITKKLLIKSLQEQE